VKVDDKKWKDLL